MKKPGTLILLALVLVFSSFCIGFFLGRNYTLAPVQVSTLQTTTAPAATVPAETTQATDGSRISVSATAEPTIAAETTSAGTEPTAETIPAGTEPTTESAAQPPSQPTTAPTTEPPVTETIPEPATEPGLINVNTADQATLMTLPGIGEKLSLRIIEYRNTYGPFRSVSELLNVEGIGEKRLAAIVDYICTGG